MAIFYNKQPRRDPFHDGRVRYYPIAKATSQADELEVARMMCRNTTLNPHEALLAIALLRKTVLELLKEGRSVRLGDWASFHATLASDGADTPEECTWRSVKGIRAHCLFSRSFMRELQQEVELKDVAAWLSRPDASEPTDTDTPNDHADDLD